MEKILLFFWLLCGNNFAPLHLNNNVASFTHFHGLMVDAAMQWANRIIRSNFGFSRSLEGIEPVIIERLVRHSTHCMCTVLISEWILLKSCELLTESNTVTLLITHLELIKFVYIEYIKLNLQPRCERVNEETFSHLLVNWIPAVLLYFTDTIVFLMLYNSVDTTHSYWSEMHWHPTETCH